MKNQKENISVIASFILVVCVIGLVVYLLVNRKDEPNLIEDINTNQVQESSTQNTEEESINTSQNDMEKVAKNGDVLVMNYTGRFTNGTVFDSNVDPKFNHVEPFKFTLGAGMVIKGWDEGLLGMKVGEKKTLTIPPEKAYGPNDYHGIPGNSTLIFEVELVGIE